MPKGKGEEGNPKEQFKRLAITEPVLPVLSDHPLEKDTAFNDRFELCNKLGPVFDIIRHPDAPTPTAIAIYGDWGTGKTSSMEWLEGLIKEWNENGKTKNKVTIRTVWFYPWKYHDKDDVWRGLISEVILKGTEIKGANIERVTKAAKQFGLFLGKGFIHTLAALKLKVGDAKTTSEAELDLSCIKDIIGEYNKNIHPEKAFLNEFENSFGQWLKDTLGDDERMVIFIDDLDRCMPQVALKVLEALKLYLNIEKLIFVIGVDKNVIDPLVKEHYRTLGLGEYKSGNYLAKMFQTEVTVGPSEEQVVKYLDYHLENVEYFKVPYVTDPEKKLFRDLINELADRNPREVKRLINSAIMSGAGIEMMKKAAGNKFIYTFAQGLQVFFIRRILESNQYNMPRLLGSTRGNTFFTEWSEIVRTNIKKDKDFPLTITIPKKLVREDDKQLKKLMLLPETLKRKIEEGRYIEDIEARPEPYHKLLENPRYSDLLILLSDKRLGQLMQIEFSAEIAEITQEAEPTAKKQDDETTIRNEIAKNLGKQQQDLTEQDYESIKFLELNGTKITDISLLEKLTNLTILWLDNNQISDISSLAKLTGLESLSLGDNQISDISALSKLTSLIALYLSNNQISDISPLAKLTNLTVLSLSNSQISDISPLAKLTNLIGLSLSNSQISDISPLSNLKELKEFYIVNCKKITDNQVKELQQALPKLKILYR